MWRFIFINMKLKLLTQFIASNGAKYFIRLKLNLLAQNDEKNIPNICLKNMLHSIILYPTTEHYIFLYINTYFILLLCIITTIINLYYNIIICYC